MTAPARRRLRGLTPALLVLTCVACEAPPAAEAEPLPVELDGACPLNTRVGLFSVAHEPNYSAVDGEIFAAVIPATVQELSASTSECRLLTRTNPFCEPSCTSGETCSQAGVCVPYPLRVETGSVTVAGLAVALSMHARADKRYFETALPHPVFSPGAPISLSSAGGEFGPLELSGRGVAPLELDASPWALAPGQPTLVSWTPGDEPDASVRLSINIDQHGLSPATLECEGPDSGSLELPAVMIDALLAAGVSGFPTGHAYRRTIDSTQTEAGCVELEVRSHRSAELEVAGHTPCTADADCPAGLDCELATETCA